ncbi:DUF1877 family protein [Maribacter algarum]|nr:DUF1877 family protein [Maribacter algarum]
MICELYRVSDNRIDDLMKLNQDEAIEYLDENYGSINGKYHVENDTVFPMDKCWAIAKYILKQADTTDTKILNSLDNLFVKSKEVKPINQLFQEIINNGLKKHYDRKKMTEHYVYRAEMDYDWEYIFVHIKTYQKAFEKASEMDDGIAINWG